MDETKETESLFGSLYLDLPSKDEGRITPMMSQFLEIKAANPDCLLFYRMGDFYELFFDDAEIASRALGITLTKRGKHLGNDIPMCGVPIHASDEYLERLIRLGHRVAVCEQTEDPSEARKRGAKSIVHREIVRLVTPGTLTEDSLLDARRNNYLASIFHQKGTRQLVLAWLDISTGDFRISTLPTSRLAAELARLEPSEIIFPEKTELEPMIADAISRDGVSPTPLQTSQFNYDAAARRLIDYFQVSGPDVLGLGTREEISAAGALLEYVAVTQVGKMPKLSWPKSDHSTEVMLIDPATRANLELSRTLSGDRKGSLLDIVDLTRTGAGSRMLANRLAGPLTSVDKINSRLDVIQFFVAERDLRLNIRRELGQAPDISRAMARLSLGRGSPRDLGIISSGTQIARSIGIALSKHALPADLIGIVDDLLKLDKDYELDFKTIFEETLPNTARDGGYIRTGYNQEFDELKQLRENSRRVLGNLQAKYISDTGFRSLKIRNNNALGYFVELPASAGDELLKSPRAEVFVHRQTMANAMRFTTPELSEIESRMSLAAEQALEIELSIFNSFVDRTLGLADQFAAAANAMAEIDVASALAELAVNQNYARPIVDDSRAFQIIAGRHPVVENALKKSRTSEFIANDCDLSVSAKNKSLWLVTGPNMAGKSTFLRQNALIAIMAQIGSFVPAKSAHVGIVDRLYSRVGAADDLARGRSTFMVEMVETATILNHAGPRAFVVLDEIGRGTATFDGLSIAWACVEQLHNVNHCRALFATHFHELTQLADTLNSLRNVSMKVREWQGDLIFLHEVGDGPADRSYGIQVAKLAGLPPAVINRAKQVLEALEQTEKRALTLPPSKQQERLPQDEIYNKLSSINPNELSPREALELIFEIKKMSDERLN